MNSNKENSVSFHKKHLHFTTEKPGKMNTMIFNFTLHHRLFIKSSAHNVHHTNNKNVQFILEMFEEDSLMIRNNSEVAPQH